MTTNVTGSCLCGAVRYELTKPPVWAQNCYCGRCRKTRGSAYAANMFVPLDGLRFTAGENEMGSYKPPGAERFTHTFCRHCGSSMPWPAPTRGMMIVPMGTLDDDPGIKPQAHIFVESKAAWQVIADDLPQFPQAPVR